MEFDFEIISSPGLYHHLAYAMSPVSKRGNNIMRNEEDVDKDVPTYSKVGKESAVC